MVQGTSLPKCDRIYVFTDSLAAARRSVDPSTHAGQAHSLAVCAALEEWLSAKEGRSITFVKVPSRLEWNIHQEAHAFATGLPPVAAGRRPLSTLDSVAKVSLSLLWTPGSNSSGTQIIGAIISLSSRITKARSSSLHTPRVVRGYIG